MTRTTQSLLCTALLLCATPFAPADIVHVSLSEASVGGSLVPYYDHDGFLWYYATGDSSDLDINGDGIVDLTFTSQASAQTGVPTGFDNYVTARNGAALGATYHTADYHAWWATPISPNDTIGPGLGFAPFDETAHLYSLSGNTNGARVGDVAWVQSPETYLPFQFNIDGSPHYGWVRATVVFDLVGATYGWTELHDAAYETQPNTPIHAGEVPEPAYAALTIGVATLLLTPRRRRHTILQH
jgi:hypothetical protein